MKKARVVLLVVAALTVAELPLETMAADSVSRTETTIFKRKRKGYKPRRGGLFNTGLFRKKNACGCPNH